MQTKAIYLDKIPYTKYKDIKLIDQDEFDIYKTEQDSEGNLVSVIANIKLKACKNLKNNKNTVVINDKEYELLDANNKKNTAGYVAISATEFVRVEEPNTFFIFWLFLMVLLLLIGLWLLLTNSDFDNDIPNDSDIVVNDIVIDRDSEEWDGKDPMRNNEKKEQENIIIPGYYKFTSSETASDVALYNPKENTVYFKYSVFNVVSSENEGAFPNREAAQAYVNNSQKAYEVCKKGDQYSFYIEDTEEYLDTIELYKVVEENNGTCSVLCEEVSPVFFTAAIEPGKQVSWNTYVTLGPGEYNLKLKIDTYDLETKKQCYGAIQAVKGIVE